MKALSLLNLNKDQDITINGLAFFDTNEDTDKSLFDTGEYVGKSLFILNYETVICKTLNWCCINLLREQFIMRRTHQRHNPLVFTPIR